MSGDHTLLERWAPLRAHPRLWVEYLDDTLQEDGSSVAEALLDPHPPERMIQALIAAEEWEAAALLLDDEHFQRELVPEEHKRLEAEVDRARAAALASWRAQWSALEERAKLLAMPPNPEHSPGEKGANDRSVLRLRAHQVRDALAQKAIVLKEQLGDVKLDSPQAEDWRVAVQLFLDSGDLAAAEELINGGPSTTPLSMPLPARPSWPHRRVPRRELLSWFFNEAPQPPGFERYIPPPSDTYAWRLLEILYRPIRDEGDVALRCLGSILGTSTTGITRQIDGWHGRLMDLAAPSFVALGRARWPNGVAVWLPADPTAPPPKPAADELIIRFALEGTPPRAPGQLLLRLNELLAVLNRSIDERRHSLLATLGAQLPLDRLFERQLADHSTRWPVDDDLLSRLREAPRPVLVSAPPGLGKTVLLQALAERLGVPVCSENDELPESGAALIDGVLAPDARSARRLVQAIHWIADQDPPPVVVIAARPEGAMALRGVREGFFIEERLPPLSHANCRRHALTMLAWGDVTAEEPWLFDRLAFLCGGNPRALVSLCEAITQEMAGANTRKRRFSGEDLDRAWESESLQRAFRALFWEPLSDRNALCAVAEALILYADHDGSITRDDLVWAVSERGQTLGRDVVCEEVSLLVDYGFVTVDEDRVTLRSTGAALLLPRWIEGRSG